MEFSPIGVCALLADSVGAYGLKIFEPLGKLILTVYASDVILCFTDVYSDGSASGKVPGKEMAAGYLESMGCNGQHHQQQRFSSDHNLCYE